MPAFVYNYLNYIFHMYIIIIYHMIEDFVTSRRNRKLKIGDHSEEVAVITGGHRGIGTEVTKYMLTSGIHVILGCRKTEEGEKFVSNLRESGLSSGKVTIFALDLASFKSIKQFADEVLKTTTKINYVINNAGMVSYKHNLTEDQNENIWQVNYLSHFLLTHLLLPSLETTPGTCRIVNVSSIMHLIPLAIDHDQINKKDHFHGPVSYSLSKVAQVMFTLHLNERLKAANSTVEVVSVHPGFVNTEIYRETPLRFRSLRRVIFKTLQEGAKSIVYATFNSSGGQYIHNCAPIKTSSLSRNLKEQQRLFDVSKNSLGLTLFGNRF